MSMKLLPTLLILISNLTLPCHAAEQPDKALAGYRAELTVCRAAHGGSYDMPDIRFFLFGMDARIKLLYRDGVPFDAESGNTTVL